MHHYKSPTVAQNFGGGIFWWICQHLPKIYPPKCPTCIAMLIPENSAIYTRFTIDIFSQTNTITNN